MLKKKSDESDLSEDYFQWFDHLHWTQIVSLVVEMCGSVLQNQMARYNDLKHVVCQCLINRSSPPTNWTIVGEFAFTPCFMRKLDCPVQHATESVIAQNLIFFDWQHCLFRYNAEGWAVWCTMTLSCFERTDAEYYAMGIHSQPR